MVNKIFSIAESVLDKVVPDADERNRLAHEIATLAERQQHEIQKAQIAVNQQEATHKSVFVSGWRPAMGWVCVSALGFNYVLLPICNGMLGAFSDIPALTPLDMAELYPVILGMLGLGTLRTYEKKTGVAAK